MGWWCAFFHPKTPGYYGYVIVNKINAFKRNIEDMPHASRTDMKVHGGLDSVDVTERRSMYNIG